MVSNVLQLNGKVKYYCCCVCRLTPNLKRTDRQRNLNLVVPNYNYVKHVFKKDAELLSVLVRKIIFVLRRGTAQMLQDCNGNHFAHSESFLAHALQLPLFLPEIEGTHFWENMMGFLALKQMEEKLLDSSQCQKI